MKVKLSAYLLASSLLASSLLALSPVQAASLTADVNTGVAQSTEATSEAELSLPAVPHLETVKWLTSGLGKTGTNVLDEVSRDVGSSGCRSSQVEALMRCTSLSSRPDDSDGGQSFK